MLSWISKPILVACDDGILPKALGQVSKKGVPTRILTVFFIVGIVPVVTGLDITIVSKMGTAVSLFNKLVLSFSFMKLVELYPEAVERSVIKISNGQAKAIGIFTMILNATLSASLFLDLPPAALIAFAVVVVLAIIVANSGVLKKIELPADLAVDYSSTES